MKFSGAVVLLFGSVLSPVQASGAVPAGRAAMRSALPQGAVVYDVVSNAGVLKAVGQNLRIANSTTNVVLGARLSSATSIVADAVVFGVRRQGDTTSYDAGWTTNYLISGAEKVFTASRTFPPGNYTFWFAYLKNGVWTEHPKRAFSIVDSGVPGVPVDPVGANESPGVLVSVGSDTTKGFKNAAVRLEANLASSTDLTTSTIIFAVRDAAGTNFDTQPYLNRPTLIGRSLQLSAQGWFPAGTYRYWVAYLQGGVWYNLGDPRSFVIEAPATVPAPPNASWSLNALGSDEFAGTSLNTSRWQYDIGYSTSGQLAFKNSNVSVSGGNLVVSARKETYAGKSYTIGAVQSLFDVPGQPSFVEVRARALTKQANVLSAIWLQTGPITVGLNPNPEIDLQETFDYQRLTSTLHIWPGPNWQQDHVALTSNSYLAGVDVSQGFHRYGLERRDGWLRFYFDGILAWEVKPAVTESALASMPRHVILSLEGHLGTPNAAAAFPTSFLVDYVRTYSFTGP